MPDIEKIFDKLPSSQRAVRVAVAAFAAVVLALIGVLFWQVHDNAGKLADASAVSRARGQALGTANAKLTQNGIPAVQPTKAKPEPGNTNLGPTTPSSTPKAERGRQGETGAQGPGPTTDQVEAAVADYCTGGRCKSGPSQAQVAAAVLTYCTSKADCQGPAGKDGATVTGPAGKDGTNATGEPGASGSPGASGAPGRAPTADEISDAVAAYCADGACRGATGPAGSKGDTGDTGDTGPAGPAGAAGSDGKNAPTFTKITCEADGSWTFQLSDGSTLTAAGPCRASTTTITVTESPTPSSTATSTP